MFPARAKDLVIYEVNLRQYTPSGTIKDFIRHLPRLKAMGVSILWIMPVHPIGEKNKKGTLGSYYSVRDYFSVDPFYGSMNDFKELVVTAHRNEMLILLDWVANHTSWDNPLTLSHPEYYTRDKQGNFLPPFPEWEDVIKLDYDNPEVWRYMIQALQYWVDETGIDGYRCDMANLVPALFWKEAIAEIRQIKDVFMLAEAEDRNLLEMGFDAIYNWNIFHVFNGFIHQNDNAARLDLLIEHNFITFPGQYNQMFFTSNHDENSWNGSAIERLGSALDACTLLTFTLPGIPLIYSGQEAGNTKRLSFFDKDLIEWKEDKMTTFYQQLAHIRKSHPALWSNPYGGAFKRISNTKNHQVFSFVREKNGSNILVIVNLSWEAAEIVLNNYHTEGEYFDLINHKKVHLVPGASWNLPAWGTYLLAK
ncbi:MAG: alpha-amylase family glycosyl hydrolase [Bacteroidales bacterium]